MAITPLPSLDRTSATFKAEVDTFFATSLPTFSTEANAAAVAMNLNSTNDTSATSNSIGTGAKTFTVSTGKSFLGGMFLVIADTAAPSTNSMAGQVTSYNTGTGELVMSITSIVGSGTKTAWTISQSAPLGGESASNKDASGGYVGKTLEKINIYNTARTFLNFFTTASTAARTWTFPDKDGTVAMTSDLPAANRFGQIVNTTVSAMATGSTAMPVDDTIPQNTEGDQYMSLAITPANASSTLVIDVVFNYANGGGAQTGIALFRDSTANALGGVISYPVNAGSPENVVFRVVVSAASTSATTFYVRAGSTSTVTFNGQAGARTFGGVMASSITIMEILP